jgi:hypothetical protein
MNFVTVFIVLSVSERAVRSRVTLREEGQVELSGERPTDLARCDTPKPTKMLSTQFLQRRRLLRSPHGNDKVIYESNSLRIRAL